MLDIQLKNGIKANIVIENNDLVLTDGLENAIILSLLCDAKIEESELPDGETSLRGWWADALSGFDDDSFGSKLWILKRENRTDTTAENFRELAKESLQWLITDGHISTLELTTEFIDTGMIGIIVNIGSVSGDFSFRIILDMLSIEIKEIKRIV